MLQSWLRRLSGPRHPRGEPKRPDEPGPAATTPLTRYSPATDLSQHRREGRRDADAGRPVVVEGTVVSPTSERLLADYDAWGRWADIELIERAHGSYPIIMAAVGAGPPRCRPITKGAAGRATARADRTATAAWKAGCDRLGDLDEWVRICQQQHASLAAHFEECLEHHRSAVLGRLDDEGARLNLAALWHRPDLKVRADAAALPPDLQLAVDRLRALTNDTTRPPSAHP